jgi:hypothetical protein
VATTIACIALQTLFMFDIPIVKRLTGTAERPVQFTGALATLKHYAHGLAGACWHGVFLDGHFRGYDHIVAVVYLHPDGTEEWLPMTTPTGQAGSYASGRQWARWAFRACNPYMDCQHLATGVRDFTAFWAVRHGIDLNDASFRLLVKSYVPAQKWQRNHLLEQVNKPWQMAGTARWKNQQFECRIGNIEAAVAGEPGALLAPLEPAVRVDWTPSLRVAAETAPVRF